MHIFMSIGEASRKSGVKVPTIRYYEQVGLLPEADRTEANRRTYGMEHVNRLKFIRHSRELGFEPEAIRALLKLQDNPAQPCADADVIAEERLAEVQAKIASLQLLEAELQRMICEGGHGKVAQCRVIETLADHHNCAFHDGAA